MDAFLKTADVNTRAEQLLLLFGVLREASSGAPLARKISDLALASMDLLVAGLAVTTRVQVLIAAIELLEHQEVSSIPEDASPAFAFTSVADLQQ
ncbi:MAG: hypothetical protein ACYC3W_10245, partial [Candidatus Nanopelagicales bacterium]